MTGLLAKGSTSSTTRARFDWDASDGVVTSGTRPTRCCALYRLTFRNVATWSGDTANPIAYSDQSNNSNDMGMYPNTGTAGASNVHARLRTTASTIASAGLPTVLDEEFYIIVYGDFTAQEVRFYADGGQWGSTAAMGGSATYRGSQFRPSILARSADSKDIEWHEVAYWHNANDLAGDPTLYVPTPAQLASYTLGQSLSSWPTPKSHIKPAGTNGAVASSISDLANLSRTFNQVTAGAVDSYAPTFVGSADLTAGSFVASSQYGDFAFTHTSVGTAHTIAGLASANTGSPTGAQIKLQKNQDGTDAVSYGTLDASEAGEKTQRLTGLSAGYAMKAFTVIETDTDVFSPVISWTFTTPRIGVRTQEIYTPDSSPSLWASETAVDILVAAEDMPSVVGQAETDSSGRLVVDLSEAPGFYVPVGASARVGWFKGVVHGARPVTVIDLDA